MSRLFEELRRRHVFRVAGTYLVVGWVVMQVAEVMAPALNLPDWVDGFFALLLMGGFPIALVLAWAFDLTPEGIERTTPVGSESPPSRFAWIDVGILVALLAVILMIGFSRVNDRTRASVAENAPGERRDRAAVVAVLPFANVSADAEQEHLSDGLAIDIVSRLESLRLFSIISPNSTFTYKDKPVTVTQIGEELGADYVVGGTVRRAGDALRVTVQLSDARNGITIWSETYDRQFVEIFELQDDITRQVAASAAPEIQRSEIGKTRSAAIEDLAAYELYLKGLRLQRTDSFEDAQAAQALLLEAVDRAPDFALAFVQLAWVEHDFITYFAGKSDIARTEAARDMALDYATRAVAIDGRLAEARTVLGHMLLHYGRIDESRRELELAIAQNPASAFIQAQVGWGHIVAGDYDAGLAATEIARRLSPHDPMAWEYIGNQAMAYWLKGDYSSARTKIQESTRLNPDNPYMAAVLASIEWESGERAEAERRIDVMMERFPDWTLETLYLTSFSEEGKERMRASMEAAGWRDPGERSGG
jgi:TolB-like protein/Tfp pilus assembly protein PilF